MLLKLNLLATFALTQLQLIAIFLKPDNLSVGEGTYFLQEYMIPRGSTSFCLYDTRGFSDASSENMEMLKRWMTKGVRHGELSIRSVYQI